MKKLVLICWLVGLVNLAVAQTTEFKEPWKNSKTAIVLDPYEGNSIDWEQLKTDTRVVGIVHQASRGLDHRDREYKARKTTAKAKDYKWGSYHLLTTDDPVKQAKFYLETIGSNDDEAMEVDLECSASSTDCAKKQYKVQLANVKKFLVYIKQQTNRYPFVYCNHSVAKEISTKYKTDEVSTKAPLWYARFKSQVNDFPSGVWSAYTLWQFSSEINCGAGIACLYRAPGTKTDMDVNVYNGTIEELKANWTQIGK